MITTTQFRSLSRNSGMHNQIEQRLDAAIKNAASGAETVIRVAIPQAWNRSVVWEVLTTYRMAGWSADIVDDSRDGDFIELQVRP